MNRFSNLFSLRHNDLPLNRSTTSPMDRVCHCQLAAGNSHTPFSVYFPSAQRHSVTLHHPFNRDAIVQQQLIKQLQQKKRGGGEIYLQAFILPSDLRASAGRDSGNRKRRRVCRVSFTIPILELN